MSDWEFKVSKADFARINRDLIRYFRRRAPTRKDPADLAAETWLAVSRSYQGRCSLRNFAFLVASRKLFGLDRKRELSTVPLPDADDPQNEPIAEGRGLDSVLLLIAGHDAIERALARISDAYRDVVRLHLQGRDNLQIAAELGLAYNTVRSKLSRGMTQTLAALRTELGVR